MANTFKKLLPLVLLFFLLAACAKPETAPAQAQKGDTVQEPTEKPADEPGDESGDQPGDEPGDEPGAQPQDEPAEPGTYFLPVMETTDVHGYIVNTDDNAVHYRMAYVADKVNDIRGRNGQYRKDRLLLLDGGDLYQGASISNLLSGKPIYVAMEMMEYDAVTVGNHEFDWGFENMVDADATLLDYEWSGTSSENLVPVLCANLYQNGSRVSSTRDYVIVEKSALSSQGGSVKVRIGVVGFAINYASSIMASKFAGQGYSIDENYAKANAMAAQLEESGQCDATVLLIHGAADDAAESLGSGSAFDLVLGGHSHYTQSGRASNGMPYLQGGRYCEHYAYADLRFVVGQEGKVSFSGVENMKTPSVSSSRDLHTSPGQNADDLEDDILAVSDQALSAISEQLNDVIGYINVGATSYTIDGSGGRAAVISNWMCDILRRIGEADVSFVNSGGIRTYFSLNGQRTRDITVADVYEMFPFSNLTYVYRITYEDLLQLFTYSLTSGGQGLFSRMTGVDCYYSKYKVVQLRKDGTIIYRDNTWNGDWGSRSLILAVSEYLATSERVDYYTGMGNPLIEWNQTSRLLFNDQVDNENAVRVLKEEAAASGGLLSIDTAAHYIVWD